MDMQMKKNYALTTNSWWAHKYLKLQLLLCLLCVDISKTKVKTRKFTSLVFFKFDMTWIWLITYEKFLNPYPLCTTFWHGAITNQSQQDIYRPFWAEQHVEYLSVWAAQVMHPFHTGKGNKCDNCDAVFIMKHTLQHTSEKQLLLISNTIQ